VIGKLRFVHGLVHQGGKLKPIDAAWRQSIGAN
jgi:hypothetical protein